VVVEDPSAPRDKEASDANWLAAVRGALVTHDRDQPPQTDVAAAPAAPAPPPVAPSVRETHVIAPPAAPSAPALPPAQAVAPAPAPVADDHPVPPGAIPDAMPEADAVAPEHHRSRLRALIAHLPVLRRIVVDDDDRN